MFPFTITLRSKIINQESESIKNSLLIIYEELKNQKIYKIEVIENRLIFQNRMFSGQGRNHLMGPIDCGHFELDINLNKIKYQYSTKRFFYISIIIPIIIGVIGYIVTKSLGIGLIGLIICCGMFGINWIITFIRHHYFFERLLKKINKRK
jgi:hypothetical protein